MKFSDLKDVAIVAAVLGGGFAVYKLLNKVPEGLTKAGEAIGGAAADFQNFVSESLFGPKYSWVFFTVSFAGGEKHAIPIKSQENPGGVDEKGRFTFRGKQFVIRDRTNSAGIREHWAFNP